MHDAKLVWVTPDAEKLIAYIARVSNPDNQDAEPASLIRTVIKRGHWSTLEMVNLCVEINTTRTIGRQWLRHAMRPQEFSQRYAEPSAMGDMVLTDARREHPTDRQMSLTLEDGDTSAEWWDRAQRQVAALTCSYYEEAREQGIAKEIARNILPEGMTPTRMYLNGYLRDWLFATRLRCGNGTQNEASLVAQSVLGIIRSEFPLVSEAFFDE